MPIDDREYARAMAAELHSEAKLKLGISVAGFGLGAMDYVRNTITLDDSAAAFEPPRICRRLQLLRDWSHDESPDNYKVFLRGA
jgi:hypothetical protein